MPATRTSPSFRITGLPAAQFEPLFAMSDAELGSLHAERIVVDAKPGYPDRIELRDAEIGESVILVNHAHLASDGPYRSSHAVFVVAGARDRYDEVDRIPDVLRSRMLSVRAIDERERIVAADLVDGRQLESLIERFLDRPDVAFLHVHYASRGCYACRVDRASTA